MNFDIVEILSCAMVLFALIDITGAIPVIINIKAKVGKINSLKTTLVAFVIMVGFLFLGERILYLLGVDISSFAMAGSLILFILAMEMVLNIEIFKDNTPEAASIVPLAFPLIAGAGTMTSLLALRAEYHVENIVIALILNMIVVYIVLKMTHVIEKLIGKVGILILRKIFGIILIAIAIKLFKTGLGM